MLSMEDIANLIRNRNRFADGGEVTSPDFQAALASAKGMPQVDPLEQTGSSDPGRMNEIVNGLASGIAAGQLGAAGVEGLAGLPGALKGLGEVGSVSLGGAGDIPQSAEELKALAATLKKGAIIPLENGSAEYVGVQKGIPDEPGLPGIPDTHLFNAVGDNLPEGAIKNSTYTPETMEKLGMFKGADARMADVADATNGMTEQGNNFYNKQLGDFADKSPEEIQTIRDNWFRTGTAKNPMPQTIDPDEFKWAKGYTHGPETPTMSTSDLEAAHAAEAENVGKSASEHSINSMERGPGEGDYGDNGQSSDIGKDPTANMNDKNFREHIYRMENPSPLSEWQTMNRTPAADQMWSSWKNNGMSDRVSTLANAEKAKATLKPIDTFVKSELEGDEMGLNIWRNMKAGMNNARDIADNMGNISRQAVAKRMANIADLIRENFPLGPQ